MSEEITQQLETSSENTSTQEEFVTEAERKTYSEDEVQKLLKALKAERESRKIYEKEVKEKTQALERFKDVNPAEWKKLQEEASIAARERAAAEERTSLLEEKYGKQAAEAVRKAEQKEKELLEFRKRYALEKVFFSAGGRTDSDGGVSFFDLMANQIGEQFRLESNGTITVVDNNGDPVLDSESGKRISPEDYLVRYKTHPIFGTFFKGYKGSGAGIGAGSSDANGMTTEDFDSLSVDEMFLRAFG
jgi:hypothetical protein